MSMNILGVHIGHDAGATLLQDGEITADVAEERFNRIKHTSAFPTNSIGYCLKRGGLSSRDIDVIAVPSSGPVLSLNQMFELSGKQTERPWLKRQQRALTTQFPPMYCPRYPVRTDARVVHMSHHMAHASAAYFTSGFTNGCLIVTADGMGDGVSVGIWKGERGQVFPMRKFGVSGSLGWAYGMITEALGWRVGDGEGKTMGLAAYGDPQRCLNILGGYFPTYRHGELVRDHDFGIVKSWSEPGGVHWHFQEAEKIADLVAKTSERDVAASAQLLLEQMMLDIIESWSSRLGHRHLCCGGGVFLNIKLNQRIREDVALEALHIFPNAGDSGLSLGAAISAFSTLAGCQPTPMGHMYWGPSFTDDEIHKVLSGRSIHAVRCKDIVTDVATRLLDGRIVGWFQGSMESGPRALGGRSILMDPRNAASKSILNQRVKFREAFRPFCPSLLQEEAEKYLRDFREERFMISSFVSTPSARQAIPAVVHVDNTVRPQVVTADANPLFLRVLQEFRRLSGVGALLNTSMNLAGEPIVCSPRDAVKCFFDSGMDDLAIGGFLVTKANR